VDDGIVPRVLDGQKLGPPIELFNHSVIATGELDLDTHELAAVEHRGSMEVPGAHEQAVQSCMFGLEYVKSLPAN
jgi:hypothetical protein